MHVVAHDEGISRASEFGVDPLFRYSVDHSTHCVLSSPNDDGGGGDGFQQGEYGYHGAYDIGVCSSRMDEIKSHVDENIGDHHSSQMQIPHTHVASSDTGKEHATNLQ